MTESLPEELRLFVREELARGRYHSLEHLVAEGLRVLREREAFLDQHREELHAQLAEGIAQAERGDLIDGEIAMERLRRDVSESAGEE